MFIQSHVKIGKNSFEHLSSFLSVFAITYLGLIFALIYNNNNWIIFVPYILQLPVWIEQYF